MTSYEITKAIEEKLVGTEYSRYFHHDISTIIGGGLSGSDKYNFYCQGSYSEKNTRYLTYRGYRFGEVKVKKQKGEYKPGRYTGTGHYSWPIVSVQVIFYLIFDNDLDTTFRKIDRLIDNTKNKKEAELIEKANLIKKMAAENNMTTNEFFDFIRYADSNLWMLRDKINQN